MKGISPFLWMITALLLLALIDSLVYAPLFFCKLLVMMLIGSSAEWVVRRIDKKPFKLYGLGTGFAAALLTLSLPASMPFGALVIGTLFAAWIVKPLFPYLGVTLNSAMAARLLLMWLFPAACTDWALSTDGLTSATPQEFYRAEGIFIPWAQLCLGRIEGEWLGFYRWIPGSFGSNQPLLLLLIAILFAYKRILNRATAISYVLTFGCAQLIAGLNPLYNLATASSLFAIIFLFSDPYSTPKSHWGKIIFGILIGAGNASFRLGSYYTEAMVYALLLANLFTPLLNRWLPPRTPQATS